MKSCLSPLRFAVPFALIVMLTACLGPKVSEKIENSKASGEVGIQRSQQPASTISYDPLQVTSQVWAGGRAVRMAHGLPLPPRLDSDNAIVLVSSTAMSLPDIAGFIIGQTGIPVRLSDGAESLGMEGAATRPAPAPALGTTPRSPLQSGGLMPTIAGAGNASALGGSNETDIPPMHIAYQGSLARLLDTVAGHFGVSWKYDGTSIAISRYETRTFSVEVMPGTTDFKDGVQSDNSGGGSSGSSSGSGGGSGGGGGTNSISQEASTTVKLDYWAELKDTLEAILGGVGTARTSPSAGTVTVITTPEIMRTIASYIDDQNIRNTRQIAITVELFTLTLNEDETYGVDLDATLQAYDWPELGLNGPPSGIDGTTLGDGFSVNVLSPTSSFFGTTAFIKAISTLGNVARVAKIPLTTLNNRPATRRIGRDIGYLAEVSVSQSGDSNFQQSSLSPGVVREGFSLQVTPRILGDGRTLLQFSLSVIDLRNLETFPSGENQIQLPETSSRVFVQQAVLNNGDSLVLSGFDQDQQSEDRSGLGSPFNFLTGGSATTASAREILFLTITPREINVPRRLPQS